MFNLVNGINQQRYRFNVDKYISNSKQVFTVQKPRVQLKLQPQPHKALAPVVAPAPKPVVAPAPAPAQPVQRLVSIKPRHTEAAAQAPTSHAPAAQAPVKKDPKLISIKPAPAVQAPAVQAPKRSSNLVKIK